MNEALTPIPAEERNRRLEQLVIAAQRTLEALENSATKVGPLGVVDIRWLAKELREGLAPFTVGAPKPAPSPTYPPPSSTALAHLYTLDVPQEFKPNDTVRLRQDDPYRKIKAGELGKVVKVHTNGKWLDIRWRSRHAHDLTTKASHVVLVAEV